MARLLVIEDEPHLAMGLRFNLEADGHEVTVATDGETGLAQLREPGAAFDHAMGDFALAYARQNDLDHAALLAAIASGRIEARSEG